MSVLAYKGRKYKGSGAFWKRLYYVLSKRLLSGRVILHLAGLLFFRAGRRKRLELN